MLICGTGNDTYFIASIDDRVTEKANEGIDTIISLFSFDLSINGANVENLDLSHADVGLHGVGNSLSNRITGTEENDKLDGGGGNDVLVGGFGADALTGGAGSDVFLYIIDANAKGSIVRLAGQDRSQRSVHRLRPQPQRQPVRRRSSRLNLRRHGNTLVQFDADGVGGNAAVILATVTNATVVASDVVF